MTLSVSRKGDIIELGKDGAYRLERSVIRISEHEARHPDLVVADNVDGADAPGHYKVFRKVDNEMGEDDNGNETRIGADGQPTTYAYRYDAMGDFTAADDDAAIDEAKRLVSAEG